MEQGRKWYLARWVLVSVLAAIGVVMSSLQQAPTYQASAQVLVDWESAEGIQTLEYREPPPIQTMIPAVDSRPVAKETIRRLGLEHTLTPDKLSDTLSVEPVEGTQFIVLSYESTDPVKATQIVNTVGEVFSEFISTRSSSTVAASVWEKATVPERPVSPKPFRRGLLTLAMGLVLSVVLALPQPRPLAPLAARISALPRTDLSEAERIKEKKLLLALGRCGRLTPTQAALESHLSVEDADRMLQALADQGHLEFDIVDGKRLYAFWREHGQ